MSSISDDVIYPPAHVRSVIDKTAQFVSKNGEQFEQRIRNEQNDASGAGGSKFAFLDPNNAYYAYYRLKLTELQNGIVVESKPAIPRAILDRREQLENKNKSKERLLALSDFRSSSTSEGPEEPEKDIFSFTQPFISSLDMDIIKITALFVARNGQKVLVELTKRERSNPQFDFLNPSHYLFTLFTTLTESYTKCLLPPKSQIEQLSYISNNRSGYLAKCQRRADWDAKIASQLESEAARKAADKAEMQSMDWHNFFIAETIKLSDFDEDLPPTIDFGIPGAIAMLRSAKISVNAHQIEASTVVDANSATIANDKTLVEMAGVPHVELPETEISNINVTVTKFSDAPEGQGKRKSTRECDERIIQDGDETIKVKKSYSRKSKTDGTSVMQKCPITGQLVPASEMTSHLRILLLDPKWKQQKDRFMEKAMKESAFAPTEDIDSNLASFVANRPDLFDY